jgi:hypothetical protein
MISAEFAVVTFTAGNSARVLAYIPQIVRIVRDRNGSPGLSCLTWTGFAAANFSSVAYALAVASDWTMVAVFGVNGVFCLAIVAFTVWTRFRLSSTAPVSTQSEGGPADIRPCISALKRRVARCDASDSHTTKHDISDIKHWHDTDASCGGRAAARSSEIRGAITMHQSLMVAEAKSLDCV